jgi:hypothetical protein
MILFCAAMVDETLPEFIRDYEDVFSEKEAGVLAQTAAYYHAVELEAGEQPPYSPRNNSKFSRIIVHPSFLSPRRPAFMRRLSRSQPNHDQESLSTATH